MTDHRKWVVQAKIVASLAAFVVFFGCVEARDIPVDKNYTVVEPPTTLLEILKNTTLSLKQNRLLNADFYSNENLRQILGGEQITRSGETPSAQKATILGFARIAKPFETNGLSFDSVMCTIDWNTKVDGNKFGRIQVIFNVSNSALSFEKIEGQFGSSWLSDPALTATPPLAPVPPRNSLHGYERIKYIMNTRNLNRYIVMTFRYDGTLGSATFSEETKQ